MAVAALATMDAWRLDAWLREARAVLAGLAADDPRRARALALYAERAAARMALTVCPCCGGSGGAAWWQRPDGEWLCRRCHPEPAAPATRASERLL